MEFEKEIEDYYNSKKNALVHSVVSHTRNQSIVAVQINWLM